MTVLFYSSVWCLGLGLSGRFHVSLLVCMSIPAAIASFTIVLALFMLFYDEYFRCLFYFLPLGYTNAFFCYCDYLYVPGEPS